MKRLFIVSVMFFALSAPAFAGKPGGCPDVPIVWTFESTTTSNVPSAINGDGKGGYRQGADGVFNSVIHFNSDCNGSRDATLGLSRSKRNVSVQFSGIPETDAIGGPFPGFNGTTITAQPFFNIVNVTGYGYPVGSTFYTKMGFGFKTSDRTAYDVTFLPFDGSPCPFTDGICVDSITPDIGSPDQNSPIPAAWVRVTHLPASGTTPDQWIVEGEITEADTQVIQRATLLSGSVHRGQFSMPFRIRLTALAPLPRAQ